MHDQKKPTELAKEAALEIKDKLEDKFKEVGGKVKDFDLKGKFNLFSKNFQEKSKEFGEKSKELAEKYKNKLS
jgi:hypothetical protein